MSNAVSGVNASVAVSVEGRSALGLSAASDLSVDSAGDLAVSTEFDLAVFTGVRWTGLSAAETVQLVGIAVEVLGSAQ